MSVGLLHFYFIYLSQISLKAMFRILTALLLLGPFAFGQTSIDNTLTPKHVLVEGTRVHMIPPKDFNNAQNFKGFQLDAHNASIMILDVPGPYEEVIFGFNEAAFEAKGMEMIGKEPVDIKGIPGMLFLLLQKAYGTTFLKHSLIFGTEKETMIINATFLEKDSKLGNRMKDALLSIIYTPEMEVNAQEYVDFSLDTGHSKLKYAGSVSGSLMYSTDGQIPSKNDDKTNIIAARSFSKLGDVDRPTYAVKRFNTLFPMITEKVIPQKIILEGLEGYEIKARNDENGYYQLLLFDEEYYFIIIGSTNTDIDSSLETIATIAHSFKLK